MKTLSIKDYELTFEGQGVPYIYEIALYKYYLPKKSVSIIKNGIVQEFMHKNTLAEMDKVGLMLTSSKVKVLIEKMDTFIMRLRENAKKILNQPLTEVSLREMFKDVGAVTKAYYFFDPHFFNGIFTSSQTDVKAKEVVTMIQEYKNVAREYFNEAHFGSDGYTPKLLKEVSKLSGVSFDNLQNYNEDEIIALMNGVKVSESILLKRKKLYVFQKNKGGTDFSELVGGAAERFCKDFYAHKKNCSRTFLKGVVANDPGLIIRGTVKCITRDYKDIKSMYRQMDDMKEGDILVTQTTDPEMMPALRKATAVVTDIGGMLSHTAIVARELNIPCIVDTRFATQVLKDGDLVEVDAERGIVKIINK